MNKTRTGLAALAALAAAAALVLAGCGADQGTTTTGSQETNSPAATTVEITDNAGPHTIDVPVASVVALDNRTFQTLADWGVPLAAAPRTLMPATNPLKADESIPDIGNHREPNLELIVAAEPDVVINGQRFTQFGEDIATLVPDATILNLDPREGEPLDSELKRQTSALGELFGKQAEADELNAELDAAVQAVKDSYPEGETVMAVNVSGGNIGYLAPGVGRTLGPVFDIFDFAPALEVEGASDDHQGDDISVEAIAESNPDWILVMDRDAAVSADDAAYVPANQVLEGSAPLAGVTAVKDGHIVYMPADTYTNEGIQTYTTFFNQLAEQFQN